jgi:hypothetical protein
MDVTECGAANPEDPIEPKVLFLGLACTGQNQTALRAAQEVADSGQGVRKGEWFMDIDQPLLQSEPACRVDSPVSNRTRSQGHCDCGRCQNNHQFK